MSITPLSRYGPRRKFAVTELSRLMAGPDIGILDVVKAIRAEDWREVTATSLGRVLQHVQRAKSNEPCSGFAIVSAWRHRDRDSRLLNPVSWNRLMTKALQMELKDRSGGFFPVEGRWTDDRTGQTVEEPSFVVPGLPLSDARRLRERYDQDAILFCGPETGGNGVLLTAEGDIDLGDWHALTPGQVADIYSSVKGRNFVFAARPDSWSEAALLDAAFKGR